MIAFTTTLESNLNIYKLNDLMNKLGWALNVLQNPAAVHICLTTLHINNNEKFIADLKLSISVLKSNSSSHKYDMAPIYGLASKMPSGPVNDVLTGYLNVMWKNIDTDVSEDKVAK